GGDPLRLPPQEGQRHLVPEGLLVAAGLVTGLEVTAGGAPRGGGGRPRDAERPRAAVSLADYLARGRE
ncbi:hypothetical protein ABZ192_39135, partial [Streptomyces sp. NPDC006235]